MDVENIYLDTSESRDEQTEAIMRTNICIFIDAVFSWDKKANQRIKSSEVMVSISNAHRLEMIQQGAKQYWTELRDLGPKSDSMTKQFYSTGEIIYTLLNSLS